MKKFEGSLWRVSWCHIFEALLSKTLQIGYAHESYLYDCSGRRSINSGAWAYSPLSLFQFFNEEDQVLWMSVLVLEIEEIEL